MPQWGLKSRLATIVYAKRWMEEKSLSRDKYDTASLAAPNHQIFHNS